MRVLERDFETWMVDTARLLGWKAWHFHDSRRQVKPGVFVGDKDAAGVCDWILLHDDPPRLVFAELKGTGGKLSDEQREFLVSVRRVSEIDVEFATIAGLPAPQRAIGVYVWTPGMEQAIEDLLRSRVLS